MGIKAFVYYSLSNLTAAPTTTEKNSSQAL